MSIQAHCSVQLKGLHHSRSFISCVMRFPFSSVVMYLSLVCTKQAPSFGLAHSTTSLVAGRTR
ncbi:hypothetical protein BC830DRAFT_1159031, partial [Chytriomyces sp. MP71]